MLCSRSAAREDELFMGMNKIVRPPWPARSWGGRMRLFMEGGDRR